MSSHPPIDTLRYGSLKASIWENRNQNGDPYWAVNFAKTYRDSSGRLADTTAFVGSDLLVLAQLANKAFERTQELRQDFASDRDESDFVEPERLRDSNGRGRRQNGRAPQ